MKGGNDALQVGKVCEVEVRDGSKKSIYPAKLLGIGES